MNRSELGIIINEPYPNVDRHRRYSEGSSSVQGRWIVDLVESGEVTPEAFPKAIDLFAGDGSWARRLTQHGWIPEDITCVDIYESPTPLVQGVIWKYMDLLALWRAIKNNVVLPKEVQDLEGKWDLTTMSYGAGLYEDGDRDSELIISNFFTRPGGVMLINRDLHRKAQT